MLIEVRVEIGAVRACARADDACGRSGGRP